MKKQTFNKKISRFNHFMIIVFICFTYFFTMPIQQPVNASILEYYFSFEGITTKTQLIQGIPNSDNIFTSEKNGGGIAGFNCSNSGYRTGNMAFIYKGGNTGWFNLTYSKTKYLTNFSVYLDMRDYTTFKMYFYNNTLGIINGCFIHVESSFTTEDLSYYVGTTQRVIDNSFNRGGYDYFGFNILNNSGYCYYYNGVNSTLGTVNKTSLVTSNYRIDRIYFYFSSTSTGYLDDIFYSLSDYYGETYEDYCWSELDSYIPTGIDNTYQTYTAKQTFKHIYNVYSTGKIRAISVCIDEQMYDEFYNLSNYQCSIMGSDWFSASCFQNIYPYYRVIWYCNIDLDDYTLFQTYIYSQFYLSANHPLFTDKYWMVCTGGIYGNDLDNDGDTVFNEDEGFLSNPSEIVYQDVGVCYWLESPYVNPDEDNNYTDNIFLSGYDAVNSTGYIYYLDNPNGIVIGYTTANITGYLYRIYLYKNQTVDGTGIDDEWYNIIKPSGEVYFPSGHSMWYPDNDKTIGTYIFSLTQDTFSGVDTFKDNVTAYIIERVNGTQYSEYYIETRPSTTNYYESYDIFYNYYNAFGYDGYIGVFQDINDRNDFENAYYVTSIIESNTSDTITFSSSIAIDNEYLTLFIKEGSSYYPVSYCTHYIKSQNAYWNEIYVDRTQLDINNGNPEQKGIHIKGTHVYSISDVWIYINNKPWASVQYQQNFDKFFIPSTVGSYKAELVFIEDNEKIILDSCTFTVIYTDSGDGGGGDDGDFGYIINIPEPFNYFAGIFVILLFTLSPLAMVVFMSKASGRDFNISSIPQFLYMILAIIGFIITIILGWFPVWTVAVLIVMCVVIITIMWLQKKNVTEG